MNASDRAAAGTADTGLQSREYPATGDALIGVACLNSPQTLNALTVPMVRALHAQLRAWASDSRVVCVVIHGAGSRAFCAGGDIRSLRQSIIDCRQALPNPAATAFFASEYPLDYLVHNFPRPVLVWGHGLVFGGGLGLMSGASHRVVTVGAQLAMPEISIGLFPDVGAGSWLRRLRGQAGLFSALTGAVFDARDAVEVGLADLLLQEGTLPALLHRLQSVRWDHSCEADRQTLTMHLRQLQIEVNPSVVLAQRMDTIDSMLAADELGRAYAAITGYRGDDPWLQSAAATLRRGSPTSAALIWRHWQLCHGLTLAQVLRLDLTLSLQCCARPDFAEGVRALLIDRDNAPRWQPGSMDAVTQSWIDAHFAPPSLPPEFACVSDPHWPASRA